MTTFIIILFVTLMNSAAVFAADNSCVLLKFTDNTKYSAIGSAEILSDLVIEQMAASRKFALKETRAIDVELERMLYDKNAAELRNAADAMESGDYDVLFEGSGFNKAKTSESIGNANIGQIVSSEITADIGRQHNVKYLIHGTIIKFRKVRKDSKDVGKAVQSAAVVSKVLGFEKAGSIFSAFGDLSSEKSILTVDVALRVIEASTGKVIWYSEVSGRSYIIGHKNRDESVMIGSHQMTNGIYAEAMSSAAENIVAALTADIDSGKLFGGVDSE